MQLIKVGGFVFNLNELTKVDSPWEIISSIFNVVVNENESSYD